MNKIEIRNDPRIIGTPNLYIQRYGILGQLGDYLYDICEKPLFLVDPIAWQPVETQVDLTLNEKFSRQPKVRLTRLRKRPALKRIPFMDVITNQ